MADGSVNVEGLTVARTLEQALDPAWLSRALTPVSGGAAVTRVETVEVIRTMATKVRFAVDFADGTSGAFCLKAFLDVDEQTARGGATTVLEADFYRDLAPRLDLQVPDCVATVIDAERTQGVIIMRDLIVEGARFCSALEPLGPDDAAESLTQLAQLHARHDLLQGRPWIQRRIESFARNRYVPEPVLQELMNGPRGEGLPERERSAGVLIAGLTALSEMDAKWPQTLVHGDVHAGNLYRHKGGFGLIDWQILQSGGWALDVVYRLNAILPVELAEREERRLLNHYLDTARGLGSAIPDPETAWTQYRASIVYGYYLWAITRKVDPAITVTFNQRLGSAVARLDSYKLLGV